MQEATDALLTIAEVAASFAGFAALVTLFARRRLAANAMHDLLRLRLVIGASIAALVAALVPVALAGYGVASEHGWQLAAGVFLVLRYFVIGSFVASYKVVRGAFDPDRLAVGVAAVLELLAQIGLVLVLIAIAEPRAYGLYVGALVATIAQAAFVFLRLVESAFAGIVSRE